MQTIFEKGIKGGGDTIRVETSSQTRLGRYDPSEFGGSDRTHAVTHTRHAKGSSGMPQPLTHNVIPSPSSFGARDPLSALTVATAETVEGRSSKNVVPEEGVEPTRPCDQRILSPPRLPFRHSGPRPSKVTRHRAPLKSRLAGSCVEPGFSPASCRRDYDAATSPREFAGTLINIPSTNATPIVTSVAIKPGFAAMR